MILAALVTDPVTIFLIVLTIILLAPVILTQLKIPHIIGMIVAGVVVGPYGFDVLDRDSSFNIFGQVGLLYLMFLRGWKSTCTICGATCGAESRSGCSLFSFPWQWAWRRVSICSIWAG